MGKKISKNFLNLISYINWIIKSRIRENKKYRKLPLFAGLKYLALLFINCCSVFKGYNEIEGLGDNRGIEGKSHILAELGSS